MGKRLLLLLAPLLLAAGCRTSVVSLPDAKSAVVTYYEQGEYDSDVEAVMDDAVSFLRSSAGKTVKAAVVLDVDDTAISTYEYQKGMGFGHNGKLWHQWIEMRRGKVIKPVLDFCLEAERLKVAVFFISGRREAQRNATEDDLARLGFPKWQKLYMKPDAFKEKSVVGFKTQCRKDIQAQGYVIIANIGDQASDCEGEASGRTFILPNLIYKVK